MVVYSNIISFAMYPSFPAEELLAGSCAAGVSAFCVWRATVAMEIKVTAQ